MATVIEVAENLLLDASMSIKGGMVILRFAGDPEVKVFGVIDVKNSDQTLGVDGRIIRRLSRITDWMEIGEGVTIKEVRARISFEKYLVQAWSLLLIVLSSAKPTPSRQKAAAILEEYLDLPGIEESLTNLFCSPATPALPDLDGDIGLTDQDQTPLTHGLLVKLKESCSQVGRITLAWSMIRDKVFGSRGNKKRLEAVLTRLGIFYQLAQGESFEAVLEALRTNNPDVTALPYFDKVMEDWQRQST